jgi:hypothetical protein
MNKYVPTATALRLNESITLGWNEPLHRADSFLGREQCPGPCDGGPGVLLFIHSLLVAKVPSCGDNKEALKHLRTRRTLCAARRSSPRSSCLILIVAKAELQSRRSLVSQFPGVLPF